MTAAKKKKKGRSVKTSVVIDEDFLLRVENAVASGFAGPEIAHAVGLDYKVFRSLSSRNTKEFPDRIAAIAAARKRGLNRRAEVFLAKAESSLLKLCGGYEQITEKTTVKTMILKGSDEDGNETETRVPIIEKTTTKKMLPPDRGAVIFTLCNVAPEKWQSLARVIVSDGEDSRGLIEQFLAAERDAGARYSESDFPGIGNPDGKGGE